MKRWISLALWFWISFGSILPVPTSATVAPTNLEDRVGFDQHLGRELPLDAVFRDEAGKAVRLGDWFGKRPVIVALAYYDCPNLCTLVLNGLVEGLRGAASDPGTDLEVVAISIDPNETSSLATKKKAAYLASYGRPATDAGWHFLTGDGVSIARVAGDVGFRYFYDDERRQYAHPAGVAVVTPDGRISRYLFGVRFAPRDLQAALADASAGRTGNLADRLLLLCFRYDPHTGRYGLLIENWIRAVAIATVLALAGFVAILARRDRLRRENAAR